MFRRGCHNLSVHFSSFFKGFWRREYSSVVWQSCKRAFQLRTAGHWPHLAHGCYKVHPCSMTSVYSSQPLRVAGILKLGQSYALDSRTPHQPCWNTLRRTLDFNTLPTQTPLLSFTWVRPTSRSYSSPGLPSPFLLSFAVFLYTKSLAHPIPSCHLLLERREQIHAMPEAVRRNQVMRFWNGLTDLLVDTEGQRSECCAEDTQWWSSRWRYHWSKSGKMSW